MAAGRGLRDQGMCLGSRFPYPAPPPHRPMLISMNCKISPAWHLVQLKLKSRAKAVKCGGKV